MVRLDLIKTGLLLAWLAMVAVLGSPALGVAHMFAAASFDSDISICHAPATGSGTTDHPAGDHDGMADCAMCLCRTPVLAGLDTPAPPQPVSVVLAASIPTPPARAPAEAPRTDAYPRGPPSLT